MILIRDIDWGTDDTKGVRVYLHAHSKMHPHHDPCHAGNLDLLPIGCILHTNLASNLLQDKID